MRKIAIGLTALLVAGATACASRPVAVPVIGSPDATALVGNWTGDYNSEETGRSGSIAFMLKAGKDTAVGSIVMVPRTGSEVVVPSDRPIITSAQAFKGETLTIRFVRVEGNQVIGTLDPYRDPNCGCQLATTFRGTFIDANTIEGTFNTSGSGFEHVPSSGHWRVTRSAK